MNFNSLKKAEDLIQKNNIEFIDIKVIDLIGRLRHVTLPYFSGLLEKLAKDGVGFDGSSYGFAKVENSDMILIPDYDTAVVDTFRESPTLSLYAHIILTDEKKTPFNQDGRHLVKKVEDLLKETIGADKCLWGPEFEFYIFKEVEYDTRTSTSFYRVNHEEEFYGKAYHAANPYDIYDDFRDKACKELAKYGIRVKYHHHEVGERGQQEIETYFEDTLTTADNILTAKYVLFNLARQHNLYITFMPKPMYHQAGNGMHLHLYMVKDGKNIFYKEGEYGNLNEVGRYCIGGILKHGPALSAFTNPSTNSYKRLVPGFEAPVALTYGMANRAGAIRIPKYVKNPQETRFEFRSPDATANPYFCLTAILLAAIDGVVNKIDPIKEGFGPFDKNISDEAAKDIHYLPRSLEDSLDALEADKAFLKRGNIISDDLLNQWIKTKREEAKSIATMPHPFEYKMYFTL
jgi:glutamine synthetase